MKKILCSTLFLSLSLAASAATYAPNNGRAAPGTFSSAAESADIGVATPADSTTSRSGMSNSSGVTTDDMNTSPNPAPATDDDLLKDTTLTEGRPESGPFIPEGKGMEAQKDEDALDYSTTPKHQQELPSTEEPSNKPNPNKIGN